MLLVFLLLRILTGIVFMLSAIALFVTVYVGKKNGLSWILAFLILEVGVASMSTPLILIWPELLPAGIAGYLHLFATFSVFLYRLFDGHSTENNNSIS